MTCVFHIEIEIGRNNFEIIQTECGSTQFLHKDASAHGIKFANVKKNYQDLFFYNGCKWVQRTPATAATSRDFYKRGRCFWISEEALESRALSIRILLHLRTITIVLIATRWTTRNVRRSNRIFQMSLVPPHYMARLLAAFFLKSYGSNKLTPWDDEWMIFYTESRTYSSRKPESLRSVAVNAYVSTILKSLI